MNKLVEFSASVALLSIAISMATITWWITYAEEYAEAPACVIAGDGRGQKK